MNGNAIKTKYSLVLVLGLFSVIMVFAVMPNSVAESQTSTPLDDKTSLEKTTTSMSVPKDNTLPWAYVRGSIDNPAQGYPVIIQFFNEENGDNPIHIAQVDVKGDDTYEYKFRVRNVNLETGKATNIF
ncbi:MAG: hypothetical protein ACE5RC_05015, partial [Nitrosopumilus sp.]